jgi:hypothetical protein
VLIIASGRRSPLSCMLTTFGAALGSSAFTARSSAGGSRPATLSGTCTQYASRETTSVYATIHPSLVVVELPTTLLLVSSQTLASLLPVDGATARLDTSRLWEEVRFPSAGLDGCQHAGLQSVYERVLRLRRENPPRMMKVSELDAAIPRTSQPTGIFLGAPELESGSGSDSAQDGVQPASKVAGPRLRKGKRYKKQKKLGALGLEARQADNNNRDTDISHG